MRFTGILAMAAALLAGGASPAGATVLLHMTVEEMTAEASLVVEGTVLHQQVVEGERHLWTETFLQVSAVHKGQAELGQILTFRQPGGETATVGMKVPGAARFSQGEEVLIFLEPVQKHLQVVGMCLGKFSITRNDDGEKRVRRDTTEARIVRRDEHGTLETTPTPVLLGEGEMPLAQLRKAIKAIVDKRQNGGAP